MHPSQVTMGIQAQMCTIVHCSEFTEGLDFGGQGWIGAQQIPQQETE